VGLPCHAREGDLSMTYAIMFDREKYRNFMDAQRQPAMPYLLVFQTKK
jgi:hypothetical protein